MIIMKFGGTSVEDAPSIERVTEIIRARLDQKPVIVVSAMGKTTRRLLQAAEASAAGDGKTTLGVVADLKTRHLSEARRLVKHADGREVFSLVEKHFDELKKLLEGLAVLGEVPPRGLDKILAYGELLSSALLADALFERGIPARLFDARELIKTDDRYGAASPLFDVTDQRIREAIRPAIEGGVVPVVQGFIGSSRDGATTTLGFEGSDYTATILGAALDAEDIQIWKDVSGLMTADPEIYPRARTVKLCSFAEAAELTHFGAKVLHPKAIQPAARKNIPVHIYNSRKPEAAGTAITFDAAECSNPIKSIAYKRPVTIINATTNAKAGGSRFTTADDLLRSLLEILSKRRAQPLIIAVSASTVVLALDARDLKHGGRDLIEALSDYGSATARADRAIVSLVGDGLRGDPRLLSSAFKAIEEIDVEMIAHGSSPMTMSFVVAQSDVENVVAKLHEIFFTVLDPRVFQ
ncbi:MAG TPA: aspartate kinase [Blastocatellia bacterium]|nr:aspartate kinase [Blastocatellia bacterium]